MDSLPVYIMAGGKSSRFGRDKARATVDGRPLIVRLAETVRPQTSTVTAVADVPDKYADLGIRTIADIQPGLGPMAGLQAALADVTTDTWLLLLSCDFVGIRPEWIRTLTEHIRPNAQTVLFRDVRWEPLLALYHSSIKPVVDKHIARAHCPMWALVEDLDHVALSIPSGWSRLRNVNVPEDLPCDTKKWR